MKTYVKVVLPLIACCLVADGCSKQTDEPQPDARLLAITAQIEEPTRTYLAGDNLLDDYWSETDAVAVFDRSNTNTRWTLSEGKDSKVGKFIATADQTLPTVPVTFDKLYALYPYSAAHTIDGALTASVALPTTQTATANAYAVGANVMTASTTVSGSSVGLGFRNAMGIVRVQLQSATNLDYAIGSVALSSAANYLAGNATIDLSAADPTVVMSAEPTNSHTVTYLYGTTDNAVVALPTDTYLSCPILVPAATYAAGDLSLSIPIYDVALGKQLLHHTLVIPVTVEVTVERAKIVTLRKTITEQFTGSTEGYGEYSAQITTLAELAQAVATDNAVCTIMNDLDSSATLSVTGANVAIYNTVDYTMPTLTGNAHALYN